MRNVIYSMGVSLDGFIAGPRGEIDWSAPDEELHRFHNQQPPKVVFSRTLEGVEGNARLVREGIADEVAKLREQPGRDLAVGGARLASASSSWAWSTNSASSSIPWSWAEARRSSRPSRSESAGPARYGLQLTTTSYTPFATTDST